MYVITSPIARRPPARYLPARRPVMLPVLLLRRGLAGPLPQDQQQIAGIAAAGATATASILVAIGTIGGPAGAAIAGLAALAVGIANLFGGCGQVCVATADIANQAEPLLDQNVSTYLSSPVRYRSMQLAALNNFDTFWAAFSRAELAYGPQGQVSITERGRGGCHYHTSPGGWVQGAGGQWSYVAPGPDGSGNACWNWFVGMRDPIANDPAVVPDPSPGSAVSAAGLLSSVGLGPSSKIGGFQVSDLLLPAALLAAAAVV